MRRQALACLAILGCSPSPTPPSAAVVSSTPTSSASSPASLLLRGPHALEIFLTDSAADTERFGFHDLGSAQFVSDGDRIGSVENGSVRWDDDFFTGVRRAWAGPLAPRTFGHWPDNAFLIANSDTEQGYPVSVLHRFDTRARAWKRLDLVGNFRAGIQFFQTGERSWAAARLGFGIGGNLPIEIVVLDGPGPYKTRALPCRSESSSIVAAAQGRGRFFTLCSTIEGEGTTILDFSPGEPERPAASLPNSLRGAPSEAMLRGRDMVLLMSGLDDPSRAWRFDGTTFDPLKLTGIGKVVKLAADAEGTVWLEEQAAVDAIPRVWRLTPEDALQAVDVPWKGNSDDRIATRAHLWVRAGRILWRRSADGSWDFWDLPAGAKLAAVTADGAAWIEGAAFARAAR